VVCVHMKNYTKMLQSEDLALFCAQTALLLKSGIPLDSGLETISETLPPEGKPLVEQLRQDFQETYSLETALEKSGIFPPYLVQMVGIGEHSGKLESVMDSLAIYYEREARMKKQLRQAVLYPMISVCAMAVVVAVLVWKVLPIFQDVLQSLGGLGKGTDMIMKIGPVLGVVILCLLGIIICSAAVMGILSKLGKGEAIRRLLIKIPPVKRTLEKISAARFASVLAMLLESGYQMEEALEFMPSILPDPVSAEKVRRIGVRLGEGESLSDAVEQEGIFPGLYGRMIGVGQRAGSMDSVMAKLAEIYEEEANQAVQSLIGTAEPAMVGILSGAAGLILLSVMLPLLGILSTLG
jgi:type IV pilus assembly protein PilC